MSTADTWVSPVRGDTKSRSAISVLDSQDDLSPRRRRSAVNRNSASLSSSTSRSPQLPQSVLRRQETSEAWAFNTTQPVLRQHRLCVGDQLLSGTGDEYR